jgi:hypothetical protein
MVTDLQLATREDRSAGHAELAEASRTLPNLAGTIGVDLGALAIGAERCAAVVREPDFSKRAWASSSDIRMIDFRLSVRALAVRRKCWDIGETSTFFVEVSYIQ